MVELSERGKKWFADYLEKKNSNSAIRVFLSEVGWGGPSLQLALDEPKESDQIFAVDSIRIVVDKGLLEKTGPIKIDFVEAGGNAGFSIQSNLQKGCSSCCWAEPSIAGHPEVLTLVVARAFLFHSWSN